MSKIMWEGGYICYKWSTEKAIWAFILVLLIFFRVVERSVLHLICLIYWFMVSWCKNLKTYMTPFLSVISLKCPDYRVVGECILYKCIICIIGKLFIFFYQSTFCPLYLINNLIINKHNNKHHCIIDSGTVRHPNNYF